MGRNNQQRRAARARERARTRSGQRSGAAFGAGWPDSGYGSNSWRSVEAAPMAAPPSPRERMLAEISAAVQITQLGDPASASPAYEQLRRSTASESGRRLATTCLRELLAAEVNWAWQHGWQPADLVRLAGRQIEPASVAVVGDAIAHDLSRYAEATLAPRWPGQLREHEVRVWWATEHDHLSARAARTAGGFDALLPHAVAALAMLQRLPELELLDPLPGTAQPRRDRPAVEHRILSRVRAFLAKAEGTPYEAEAETFTAAAQQLMARHSIDAAMLAAAAPTGDGTSAVRVSIDRPYEAPKVRLLSAVADANRCRTVWSEALGFVTLVGFEGDLIAVETLFTSLLVQATTALAGHGRQVSAHGASNTRSFRSSFLTAFAVRIGQRLTEVTAAEAAAAQERARAESGVADVGPGRRSAGPGRDVALVLDQRRADVDEAVSALFPRLVTRRARQPTNAAGWTAGVHAADQASLFGAAQVGRRRA